MVSGRRQLLLVLVSACAGMALGITVMVLGRMSQPAPIVIEPPPPTAPPTPQPGWRVYVSGAVAVPGVYEVPYLAIVQDALVAAGGFTDLAAADAVNLARPLSDGEHLRVPALAQEDEGAAGQQLVVAEEPSPARLNLNTATTADLQALPGIGPSTAANIVAFREAHGPFLSIEAIMDVPGIGPAKFAQLADLITAD